MWLWLRCNIWIWSQVEAVMHQKLRSVLRSTAVCSQGTNRVLQPCRCKNRAVPVFCLTCTVHFHLAVCEECWASTLQPPLLRGRVCNCAITFCSSVKTGFQVPLGLVFTSGLMCERQHYILTFYLCLKASTMLQSTSHRPVLLFSHRSANWRAGSSTADKEKRARWHFGWSVFSHWSFSFCHHFQFPLLLVQIHYFTLEITFLHQFSCFGIEFCF